MAMQQHRFTPNGPAFLPAFCVEGFDFGNELGKRNYRARKDVNPQLNCICYTEMAAQSAIWRFLGFGCYARRPKIAVFILTPELFSKLSHSWPSSIELSHLEFLIKDLGAFYQCSRNKVQHEKASIYIFAITPVGHRLGDAQLNTWSGIISWSYLLPTSSTWKPGKSNMLQIMKVPAGAMLNALPAIAGAF